MSSFSLICIALSLKSLCLIFISKFLKSRNKLFMSSLDYPWAECGLICDRKWIDGWRFGLETSRTYSICKIHICKISHTHTYIHFFFWDLYSFQNKQCIDCTAIPKRSERNFLFLYFLFSTPTQDRAKTLKTLQVKNRGPVNIFFVLEPVKRAHLM